MRVSISYMVEGLTMSVAILHSSFFVAVLTSRTQDIDSRHSSISPMSQWLGRDSYTLSQRAIFVRQAYTVARYSSFYQSTSFCA